MRIVALMLLWLIQAILMVLLVNAQWVEKQTREERASIERQFGERRSNQLESHARATYDRLFVETGMRESSYARLLPDPTLPKHGMEGLAPWFFEWLHHRLDAFWALVYQATWRLYLINEWRWVLGAILAAAAFDGMIQRRIKQINHALASADKYAMVRFILLLLLIAPLAYLSAPLAVTPLAVPVWGATLSFAMMLVASHAQHRV
jgi:Domain of unknown function (DUF4400)